MQSDQFQESFNKNTLTLLLSSIQKENFKLKWTKFIFLILIYRVFLYFMKGKITYKESETFTPGKEICVFDT